MENNLSLQAKVVLIAGRLTEVYLQIIHSFLKEGAVVIAPCRSLADVQKIKGYRTNNNFQKLVTEITDVPDQESAALLAETIAERFGQIDITISMFTLLHEHKHLKKLSCDDWFNLLDDDLNPFVVSAVVALEAMKGQGAGLLVHITDSSQFDEDLTGLSMLVLNTKLELSRLFACEAEQGGVSYYHLWVQNIHSKKRFPLNSNSPRISAEMVSEHIKRLYANKRYDKGKVFQLFPDEISVG